VRGGRETCDRGAVLVGAMNNPARPLEEEVARIAAAGFDFVDLTLEPPRAWPLDGERVARLLAEHGLGVVGHTAPYLPIASPFAELREQAHALLARAFATAAAAGATVVNVHPDGMSPVFARDEVRRRNSDAIAVLADAAAEHGLELMVENLWRFGTADDLAAIFDAAPGARFHLDIGHAHLAGSLSELATRFSDRLVHVHVHDNFGNADVHLPLGAGTVPWADVVAALHAAGYDGTVTIEVVAPAYVERSRELWLEWWRADAA
jgi:sugar phosphate isomerase/epimerase